MALKLGVEKAYARIEWNVFNLALNKANIRPRFINLIMACVTSSSFIVKVNIINST